MERTQAIPGDGSQVGGLLHRISDDLKVLARDELELAKGEMQSTAKTAAFEAAAVVLGGIVALIGLGLLCLTAVAALAPVIPALWLRLLIMAAIYIVVGGAVAAIFAKRLRTDAVPDMGVASYEAKRTLKGLTYAVGHSERPANA
jgi:hypothetical protein